VGLGDYVVGVGDAGAGEVEVVDPTKREGNKTSDWVGLRG
jgi:hypothetical protein